ncbi:MAG: TIGR00266 family protein [Oscillospiraceae bacterium]|nr:TIGR00266 family protein [Oscillospiraceae bacterium]
MKYEIKCAPFPIVDCTLDSGEQMIAEGGAMVWMTPNMKMETTGGGGLGRMFSRAIAGEHLFQNIYTAEGGGGKITFGSKFPGRIMAVELEPGKELIMQKSAFLASERSVKLETYLNERLGAGFFGGEGFILQRLSGSGIAFVEIDGELVEYTLGAGEQIVVDTGNVAGFEGTVDMTIRKVAGAKNAFLGGEGFFNTVLTGPGKIWLQTMPIVNVANAIRPYIPTKRD